MAKINLDSLTFNDNEPKKTNYHLKSIYGWCIRSFKNLYGSFFKSGKDFISSTAKSWLINVFVLSFTLFGSLLKSMYIFLASSLLFIADFIISTFKFSVGNNNNTYFDNNRLDQLGLGCK